MRVGLIWAQTTAGVIGRDGTIPWHLPEDLAHFKAVTLGHPVVMGRKTWESLPQRFRPLPGRTNIVVSRSTVAEGAEVVADVPAALELAGDTTWVIGGSQIYGAALPFADTLEITEIDADIAGDTFAPRLDDEWPEPDDGPWQTSRVDGLRYRFRSYRRIRR